MDESNEDDVQQGGPFDQDEDVLMADGDPPQAAIAVIHKFPIELLTIIFIHSTLSSASHGRDITPNDPPLSLLHVCKHWRSIALGVPQLFTSVALIRVLKVNPLIIVPLFLQRSRSLPLQISLNPVRWKLTRKFPQSADTRAVMLRLLGYISKHVFRCQKLSVRDLSCDGLARLLPAQVIDMPILQSLKLDNVSFPVNRNGGITIVAPNVTTLFLGFNSSTWQKAIKYDALRLQELVIDHANKQNLEEIAKLTHVCINLEVLKCHGISGDRNWQGVENFPLMKLDRLRLFSLSWSAVKVPELSVDRFLQHCYFPRLAYLRLLCYNFPQRARIAVGVTSLFEPSTPDLPMIELHLEQLDISYDEMVSLLRGMPHLKTLTMKGQILPTALIDMLTLKAPHPEDGLCPKLSLLSLVASHLRDDGRALITLIETRATNRFFNEGKLVFELYGCHGISRGNFVKLVKIARTLEPQSIEVLL